MELITDKYGRSFKTLRVSLLNKCNFGCSYCTMGEAVAINNSVTSRDMLPYSNLLSVIEQLHGQLDLKTIRLTGGEPLLYPHLKQVIEGIRKTGIAEIKLTTNGFLLEKMAVMLKMAGLQSVNVSLDAMEEDIFFLISKRNNVQRILNGIDAAMSSGLEVKINTVIMKGLNHSQVLPLLEYAFERNIVIRFLEVMAMGHLHEHPEQYLFSQQEILDAISKKYTFSRLTRQNSSTANYWQTTGGNVFGIIANETEPFCQDCNRLRIDSHGNMYGCLSSNHPISLLNVSDETDLQNKLKQALSQKQDVKFTGSALSMLDIGG